MLQCITDEHVPAEDCLAELQLHKEQQALVLALRGLLACGLLLHSLQRRHRVDYGVNR